MYKDILIFEVAKVKDTGNKYLVEYVTQSVIPWAAGIDSESILPLNNLAAEVIKENQLNGKEVYIKKDWNFISNEVLVTSLEINPKTDLTSYKRRACTFIKSFINPMMASAHASVVYGFITLNNKFIERGFVFSETNRSLKYIAIMEKAEEVAEDQPELSDELMSDLEKFIEYKETLSRTNFIWEESEKYIDKIESVSDPIYPVYAEDNITDEIKQSIEEYDSKVIEAKQKIDSLCKEFQLKINTLNNLK